MWLLCRICKSLPPRWRRCGNCGGIRRASKGRAGGGPHLFHWKIQENIQASLSLLLKTLKQADKHNHTPSCRFVKAYSSPRDCTVGKQLCLCGRGELGDRRPSLGDRRPSRTRTIAHAHQWFLRGPSLLSIISFLQLASCLI